MTITKSAGSLGVMCEKVDVSEEKEEVRVIRVINHISELTLLVHR